MIFKNESLHSRVAIHENQDPCDHFYDGLQYICDLFGDYILIE